MAKYGIKSHILMETRKMACMEILLPKRKRSKKFAFLQQKKHMFRTRISMSLEPVQFILMHANIRLICITILMIHGAIIACRNFPILKEAKTASGAWTKNL